MVFAYRIASIVWIVGMLLRIYFLLVFWIAVYEGNKTYNGITLTAMITYSTLSMIQLNCITYSDIRQSLLDRVREGNIIIDLFRPYKFLYAMFARAIGGLISTIPIAGATLVIAILFKGMQLPSSPEAGFVYLISLLLGFVLNFLISIIIGLTAFWTLELSGINWASNLLVGFLSGALIPFWFLPPTVQQITNLLPFQGIIYIPISIYIGKITGSVMWFAISSQLLWIGILSITVSWIWKAAQHKLVVQGG
ncbi:ABC transporter permease [Reticulibacter mediterranei]|nr:ABC-2 family transporter protein [Reticulibacter mediterranei]